jgi:hypothetical protein
VEGKPHPLGFSVKPARGWGCNTGAWAAQIKPNSGAQTTLSDGFGILLAETFVIDM